MKDPCCWTRIPPLRSIYDTFLNFRSRFSKDLRSPKMFMKRTAACRMDAIDQPGCRHLFLRRGLWRSFEEVCSSALRPAILRKSFRRPERSPCPNKSIWSVVNSGPKVDIYIYTATEVAPEVVGVLDRQPLVWGSLRLAPIILILSKGYY